jgi:hypothetical protein
MSGEDEKMPLRGVPQHKAEKRNEAEDVVAAFLAAGGTVKRMPTVEATAFACGSCGHAGVLGVSPGKTRKCPKCRALLK